MKAKEIKLSKEKQFLDRLQSIYPEEYSTLVDSLEKSTLKSFRVNKLKSNEEVVKKLTKQGFRISKGPLENSYVYEDAKDNIKLSETLESESLEIYLQELSSMLPCLILDLRAGLKILDMCAAPGSKTTQIADIIENKGEIIANEQSRERFFKLQSIIKMYGADVKTYKENGKILPYKFPNFVEYFDRILLDTPCSNESSLKIGQVDSFKYWRSSNSSKLSKLQKGLLSAAIDMLRPGGILVYSTCTFAVEENEEVVNWALKKFPKLKLLDFKKDLKLKNLSRGLTQYKNREFDKTLIKSVRVKPDNHFKGFYLAKFTKE